MISGLMQTLTITDGEGAEDSAALVFHVHVWRSGGLLTGATWEPVSWLMSRGLLVFKHTNLCHMDGVLGHTTRMWLWSLHGTDQRVLSSFSASPEDRCPPVDVGCPLGSSQQGPAVAEVQILRNVLADNNNNISDLSLETQSETSSVCHRLSQIFEYLSSSADRAFEKWTISLDLLGPTLVGVRVRVRLGLPSSGRPNAWLNAPHYCILSPRPKWEKCDRVHSDVGRLALSHR